MENDYWSKLLEPSQIDNFIAHIEMFKPRLIFFSVANHKNITERKSTAAIYGDCEGNNRAFKFPKKTI